MSNYPDMSDEELFQNLGEAVKKCNRSCTSGDACKGTDTFGILSYLQEIFGRVATDGQDRHAIFKPVVERMAELSAQLRETVSELGSIVSNVEETISGSVSQLESVIEEAGRSIERLDAGIAGLGEVENQIHDARGKLSGVADDIGSLIDSVESHEE